MFGWKRKKAHFELESFKLSQVPILTLDKLWHNLFPPERKSKNIKSLEKRLNELIKEQGKLMNEHREYTNLKKKMLGQIMELTSEAFEQDDQNAREEMEKNQKYILEINQKLEGMRLRLQELPEQIQNVNGQLIQETVEDCYGRMEEGRAHMEELEKSIEILRNQLKDMLQEKTYYEEQVEQSYSYLHHILGPTFIEKLDQERGGTQS